MLKSLDTFLKRTWAEIDLDVIRQNYTCVRQCTNPNAKIMCVVKADAYGYGAVKISQEFENLGANYLAVSNIEEAIQLRKAGINIPILILSHTPIDKLNLLYDYDITQTIVSEKYAEELSKEVDIFKKKMSNNSTIPLKLKVHIKIDTGMNRVGIQLHSMKNIITAIDAIYRIFKLKNLQIEGVFTHFTSADEPKSIGKDFTYLQYKLFSSLISKLKDKGMDIPYCHCCNSGAILNYPELSMDMIRPGIILYDSCLVENLNLDINIKPAMQLKTAISLVKISDQECSVSYGRTEFLKAGAKAVTVPIGYADGLNRNLSSKFYMLINGQKAPIVGRVCMDQTVLNASKISGPINEGDIVTVLGKDGENTITTNQMAECANTISDEILCLIGKRVPRVYYRNGKIDSILHYI